MAQVTSGQVLRETRERKGYDVSTVAHRLRIRADILRAIEANDFSSMPSRGYTRNMINAYARLLGLNPTEIVNMYLDEAYAYQVKRARNKAQSASFERYSNASKRREAPDDTGSLYEDSDDFDEPRGGSRGRRTSNRRLYDDRTVYSRDDYGIPQGRQEESGRSSRDYLSNHSSYSRRSRDGSTRREYGGDSSSIYSGTAQGRGSTRQQRQHRSLSERRRGNQIYAGQTPMSYSAPRLGSGLLSHLPLLIIGVAVIVIIVILIAFFFARPTDSGSSDVSTLPVSGISDTTGTSDDNADEELTVEIAPTSARIVYSVPEGKQAYVEIYADGSETPQPEMLNGPFEKTVDTTGTWTITTFAPDNVEVTVNGDRVILQPNEKYGGMSSYTVDFQAILQEWKRTHDSKSAQRSAALADASSAANAEEQAKNANSTQNGSNGSGAAGTTGTTGTGAGAANTVSSTGTAGSVSGSTGSPTG